MLAKQVIDILVNNYTGNRTNELSIKFADRDHEIKLTTANTISDYINDGYIGLIITEHNPHKFCWSWTVADLGFLLASRASKHDRFEIIDDIDNQMKVCEVERIDVFDDHVTIAVR